MDINNKIYRIETNGWAVATFGIIAAAITGVLISGQQERRKRAVEFKKIEADLRVRNADMVARSLNPQPYIDTEE